MKISKELVLQTAAKQADIHGQSYVTLKSIADELGIKTPSLYNHIKSLDALLQEVAQRGMTEMNDRIIQSVIGISGQDAVRIVGTVYFQYVIEHPGVYEIIQWAVWHNNDRTLEIFTQYSEIMERLIISCGYTKTCTEDAVRIVTGLIHGYVTMHLGDAIKDSEKEKERLSQSIEIVFNGMEAFYHK